MGSSEEGPSDYEALVGVVSPGKTLTVDVEPKNAFVIRYGDLLTFFDAPSAIWAVWLLRALTRKHPPNEAAVRATPTTLGA